jgi:putative oxidoreductase
VSSRTAAADTEEPNAQHNDRSDHMGLATTTLRIGLGGLMVGHGLQKLVGKFDGPGLDATGAGFEQMGMSPGKSYATAAALTETIGGGLLVAGLLTPLGASMVTGAMTVAVGKVHGKNGMWLAKGGMEYNLTLIGAAFAVTEHGPGFPAFDGLITKRRKGFGWAVAELVTGVAGGLGVMALADRTRAAVPEAADKLAGAASDAAAKISDTASEAAERVSGAATAVAQKVNDAADSVSEKASDAANAVSEKAADAANTVSDRAADADDAVSSTSTNNS